MKNNRGITLVVLIVTIVILALVAGFIVSSVETTYEDSSIIQFSSYMQMIQKKVDLYVEEGTDIETLGKPLSVIAKNNLQTIIDSDTKNVIETTDVNGSKLRYFSSNDISEDFGINGIVDEIIVNFENREVISLNGVEKDEEMYYVIRGL